MKTKLLLLLVLAYCVHTATQHPKDAANTSIAPVAPAATPSGAWMWQEHGPNPLDAGTYYGGYVPGKSVSLTPFSSNGGSIIKAAENEAGQRN